MFDVFQVAAEAKGGHVQKSILPPFADIPPLRCGLGGAPTVGSRALWPFGADPKDHPAGWRCPIEQQDCGSAAAPTAAPPAGEAVDHAASTSSDALDAQVSGPYAICCHYPHQYPAQGKPLRVAKSVFVFFAGAAA